MNEKQIELENKKLEIKKLLLEKGIYEKVEKIDLEKKKLEFQIEEKKSKNENTLLQKGILVALIGVFATVLGSLFDGCNSRKLEKYKLNSSLILKAIETKTPKESAKSLEFLIYLQWYSIF